MMSTRESERRARYAAQGLVEQRLEVADADPDPPGWLEVFFSDAASVAGDVVEAGGAEMGGYEPADPVTLLGLLRWLRSLWRGAETPVFWEWGAGVGVISAVASECGFRAFGIEREGALVEAGCGCLRRHGLDRQVVLRQGSYRRPMPTWVAAGGGKMPDVVYAYPWPGEEASLVGQFAAEAAPGSLLLLYRGLMEVEVWSRGAVTGFYFTEL